MAVELRLGLSKEASLPVTKRARKMHCPQSKFLSLVVLFGILVAWCDGQTVEQPLRSILVEQVEEQVIPSAESVQQVESTVVEPAQNRSKPETESEPSDGKLTTAKTSTPENVVSRGLGVVTIATAAGPKVKSIEANGLGYRAGLRPGDIIMSLNGQEIYSQAELENALVAFSVKDNIDADLLGIRFGRPVSLKLNSAALHRQLARRTASAPSLPQENSRARAVDPKPTSSPVSAILDADPLPLASTDPALSAPVGTTPQSISTLELNAPIGNQPNGAVVQSEYVTPVTPEPITASPASYEASSVVKPNRVATTSAVDKTIGTKPSSVLPIPVPVVVSPKAANPVAQPKQVFQATRTNGRAALQPPPTPQHQSASRVQVVETVRLPNGQLVRIVRASQQVRQPTVAVVPRPGLTRRPVRRAANRTFAPVRRILGRN